ncbi:aminotransferase class I/II-fold pyridoxal phosphate-dependent enzyme [Colwelliaceae bacterium 6441]
MINLPAHLHFIQGLNCSIQDSLSNASAQSLTLGELCQLADQAINRFQQVKLGYAPLKGDLALRQRIVEFHQQLNHHQTALAEDNVLTFCGAQEALASIYQTLLSRGDEVVVLTPNYPSLTAMAEDYGCIVKKVNLDPEQGWHINFDDIKRAVNKRTKLIVLNSPHNPSGVIIDSSLAEQILELAKQYNCYLLADDVSQASNYQQHSLSHRYLDYDKGLVVSVLSKSFGLAGIRIGWVISKNKRLINNLLAIKSYGSICCSAIDEAAANLALTVSDKILKNNNDIIKENTQLFTSFIDEHSEMFSWTPPQAGILAIVKVNCEQPIELWAKNFVEKTGVLILPTSLFGLSGNYFRLGLGQKNFKQLLSTLSRFVDIHHASKV